MSINNRLRRLEEQELSVPATVIEIMQLAREVLEAAGEEYDPLTSPSCDNGMHYLGDASPTVCNCGDCREPLQFSVIDLVTKPESINWPDHPGG